MRFLFNILFIFSVLPCFMACDNSSVEPRNREQLQSTDREKIQSDNKPQYKLRDRTPSEENIEQYRNQIYLELDKISSVYVNLDSLFALIDSTKLCSESRNRINYSKLVYMTLSGNYNEAEDLSRKIFLNNNTQQWSQVSMKYDYHYYMSYIKANIQQCDSAQYYLTKLRQTMTEHTNELHDEQIQNGEELILRIKNICH